MKTDTPPDAIDAALAPAPLSAVARTRILLYLGVGVMLLGFGSPTGGLIGTPISFFLKNKLHLPARDVALFGLVSQIPLYVAFGFGFARDRFNPLGRGDRGFMILFGVVAAALYLAFAFLTPTYGVLMAAIAPQVICFLFIASAVRGLTSMIGQQRVMTGQVSAAWHIFEMLPNVAAMLAGGVLSQMLEGDSAGHGVRTLFLIAAAVMAAIAVHGLWRPASLFDNIRPEHLPKGRSLADVRRLLGHWPIYPALLIWLMWCFAPGSITPFQYYLQNTLRASDAQWGQWHAIAHAAFLPPLLLSGLLCRRVPLKYLLFWGTAFGVPQYLPLIFVHTMTGAMWTAVWVGLTGGVASAAIYDLIIRSCPRGLHGTVLMASVGMHAIDSRFGDVLGTWLYERFGGFTVCALAITAVYALILPTLLLVPRGLTATADGEAPRGA